MVSIYELLTFSYIFKILVPIRLLRRNRKKPELFLIMWYEKKKKFVEGIRVISKLSNETFEENLKNIHESFKSCDGDLSLLSEIDTNYKSELTTEESSLADKTFLYLSQRLDLFLLSPSKLQSDLSDLGFTTEKADIVVKFYSESTREIGKSLQMEESDENDVTWTLKTTLSDDVNSRCRKPAVRLSLKINDQELTLDNLGRKELGDLFEKFENIQKELDNLESNKS